MGWAAAVLFALAAATPVVVMVDKPVTVSVAVPEQVRQAKAVILRIEGVVMRRNAPANWNVFWETANDAHLVGYVSSPANSALRDPKPANFNLSLPAAAVMALHRHTTLRLTFAPIGRLPEGGVTITSVRFE